MAVVASESFLSPLDRLSEKGEASWATHDKEEKGHGDSKRQALHNLDHLNLGAEKSHGGSFRH